MTKKDTYVYDHNNNYYCHRHDPSPYAKTGLLLILFLLFSQSSFAQSVSGPVQPVIPCTSGNTSTCGSAMSVTTSSNVTSVSGTITSTTCPGTGCVSLAIGASAGAGFHIQGTWTATLVSEGSYDGGTTWFSTDIHNELAGSEVIQSAPTTNGPYHYMLITGFTHVRIRASAYTSGTVSVVIVGTNVPHVLTDYQQSEGNTVPSMRVFIGGTDGTNMRGIGVLNSSPAGTEYGAVVRNLPKPTTLSVNATAATGVAVTATLPAVASQYHYITLIEISHTTSAALTAGTTPVLCTTTNFTAANTFPFDAAADAQGTQAEKMISPVLPIRSSAVNTATTIVCPATTGVIWTINVWYYSAP